MNREYSVPGCCERMRHLTACMIAAILCLGAGSAVGATQAATLPSLERVFVNPAPRPMRLRALQVAQGGELRAARIVMISVDGERDTPAALQAFLATFSPDFIGLTGDPRMATKIAARFSAVFFKEPAGKDGNYKVGHSGQIFVVDKQGRLRASFADASIDDMAQVVALLVQERD